MAADENPSEVLRLIAFLDARVRKYLSDDPHNSAAIAKLWTLGVDDFSLFVDLCALFRGASYAQRLNDDDRIFLKELRIQAKE